MQGSLRAHGERPSVYKYTQIKFNFKVSVFEVYTIPIKNGLTFYMKTFFN